MKRRDVSSGFQWDRKGICEMSSYTNGVESTPFKLWQPVLPDSSLVQALCRSFPEKQGEVRIFSEEKVQGKAGCKWHKCHTMSCAISN